MTTVNPEVAAVNRKPPSPAIGEFTTGEWNKLIDENADLQKKLRVAVEEAKFNGTTVKDQAAEIRRLEGVIATVGRRLTAVLASAKFVSILVTTTIVRCPRCGYGEQLARVDSPSPTRPCGKCGPVIWERSTAARPMSVEAALESVTDLPADEIAAGLLTIAFSHEEIVEVCPETGALRSDCRENGCEVCA